MSYTDHATAGHRADAYEGRRAKLVLALDYPPGWHAVALRFVEGLGGVESVFCERGRFSVVLPLDCWTDAPEAAAALPAREREIRGAWAQHLAAYAP